MVLYCLKGLYDYMRINLLCIYLLVGSNNKKNIFIGYFNFWIIWLLNLNMNRKLMYVVRWYFRFGVFFGW